MGFYETTSRTGPDGKLHIDVPPVLANMVLRVRIEPENGANGGLPEGTRPARAMTQEEWREFVRSTAGSMPDFPELERPGPGDYEKRDLNW